MPSVNFIIPYFGKLPKIFPVYLKSVEYNKDFHWTLLTDDHTLYKYPSNFRVVYTTFEEVRQSIQEKFDFPIKLDAPYKFCDLKPLYGYLFSEYNKGFHFWGYCDIDVVLGNLSHFLPYDIFSKYDKIYTLGHMTLIRNQEKFNKLFMEKINGREVYKEVLMSGSSFNFDEDFKGRENINMIFRNLEIPIYQDSHVADIYTKSNHFYLDYNEAGVEKEKSDLFVWNNGILTGYKIIDGKISRSEYQYIHLQKRPMKIFLPELDKVDYFKIIPNEITELECKPEEVEKEYNKIKKFRTNNQYLRIRTKNLKIKLKHIFGN